MQLSVVIPTLNRPDALPRTLDALEAQTLAPEHFEVVLVEDAQNEGPAAAGGRPFAMAMLRGARPGASAARNAGWRAARAPLVLLLGDDILAAPDLLDRHLAAHERAPGDDMGVLGNIRWADELPRTAFMDWLDRGIQFDYGAIRGSEAGAGHFYSSNVSLKKAALERAGGFDEERFPFLYEDIDLGMRLYAGGFRLVYEPRAAAEHLHRPTLEGWRRRMALLAPAERAWIERHPDQAPYFHDRFADALSVTPSRAAGLLRRLPPSAPAIGGRARREQDLYYRRELGRAFMDAWPGGLPR
jgi:GT2 family glycosyltransferase